MSALSLLGAAAVVAAFAAWWFRLPVGLDLRRVPRTEPFTSPIELLLLYGLGVDLSAS